MEIDCVRNKCDRNKMERHIRVADEEEAILNCYRRVQRLLSQISVSASTTSTCTQCGRFADECEPGDVEDRGYPTSGM
jgi:hypothetical protein